MLFPCIVSPFDTAGVVFANAIESLNPQAWYAPTRLNNTVAATGALIDSIQDISGNGNNLSSSGADRPDFVDDGGANVVNSNAELLTSSQVYNGVQAETIFMVVKMNAEPSVNQRYLIGSSTPANYGFSYIKPSGAAFPEVRYVAGGFAAGTTALRNVTDMNFTGVADVTATYRVICARRSRGLNIAEVSSNGCVFARETHTAAAADGVQLQVGGVGAVERANFNWKEVVYFNRYLSDEEVTSVVNFLTGIHNITPFPAWTQPYNDYVRMAATAKGYTSAANFTKDAFFFTMLGDSVVQGNVPKTSYYPMYLQNPFTDALLYNNGTSAPVTVANWATLDTGDSSSSFAGANDGGVNATNMGVAAVFSRELQKRITPISEDESRIIQLGGATTSLVNKSTSSFSLARLDTIGTTNLWSSFRRFYYQAMNEMVFDNNTFPIDYGTFICLGNTDVVESQALINTYTTELTALVAAVRGSGKQGLRGRRGDDWNQVYKNTIQRTTNPVQVAELRAVDADKASADANFTMVYEWPVAGILTGSSVTPNAYHTDQLFKDIAAKTTGSLGKYILFTDNYADNLLDDGTDELIYTR